MLIGYVSNERYVALIDVGVEFQDGDGNTVTIVKSSPRGAIFADVAPGEYKVTLHKAGFGPKIVNLTVAAEHAPYQFRLLSDRIVGYMWPKWVKSGDRGEFRVHATEPYRLSFWRYGLEKEFIKLISWIDEHGPGANMQITPDGDYVQTGVQWNQRGYGAPSQSSLLEAPERSGLYYVHVEGESGEFFSFPWIVAPKEPTARIAVLASTNTWNAYNNFGGRSNYINADQLPATPIVNARLELSRYYYGGQYPEWRYPDEAYLPLSFERPEWLNHIPEFTEVYDNIEGRQACHVAPTEWRLLAWLEREGFEHDFYSEYQLHAGDLDLDAYEIVISAVHPEYWSAQMYHRIKEWVQERGGKFMYLGGNGLNAEVEFIDDQTMRVNNQVVGHPSGGGVRDPEDSSRTFESRFHRNVESEANLLGVVFTEAGVMTAAPYAVVDPEHWVFAGTGLKKGDLFGIESQHERIPGGASGHETDKRSASSPANTVLLAKGTNPDEGGSEMVIYDTESGGSVFSVGSITYCACLLVDEPLSQVTANVINKFLGN
ncbi:MAG: N,N-dimethylformamidase beta subunit family domain-containing protein [Litorilinea sp.]